MVLLQGDQVVERIDVAHFCHVDDAHVKIPAPGSGERLVEHAVIAVEDGPLDRDPG